MPDHVADREQEGQGQQHEELLRNRRDNTSIDAGSGHPAEGHVSGDSVDHAPDKDLNRPPMPMLLLDEPQLLMLTIRISADSKTTDRTITQFSGEGLSALGFE